jgi:hypothetical protein
VLSSAHVYAAQADKGERREYGGGPLGSLRAYQAFHPDAAIYTVTYRGRTVWMTSKQRAIWHEVQKYWKRGKKQVLQDIADATGASKPTVSRFLRRLDLWRFIDLVTIRGHGGGTYIFTRKNEPAQRWTMSKRARIRALLANRVRREAIRELKPLLDMMRERLHLNAVRPSKVVVRVKLSGEQMRFSGEGM